MRTSRHFRRRYRKGIGLIFPNQVVDTDGNVSEIGDAGGKSGKSYLFFLTIARALESAYPERGRADWESTALCAVSGAFATVRENPMESLLTHLVVLITASGLQGEQPLVDRTM